MLLKFQIYPFSLPPVPHRIPDKDGLWGSHSHYSPCTAGFSPKVFFFGLRMKLANQREMLTVTIPQNCRRRRCTVPVIHSPVTKRSSAHIYFPTSLEASTEPTAPIQKEAGCAQKRRCTFWIKDRNFTPSRIEPQTFCFPNQYLVTTLKDPSRFQHVIQMLKVR